MRVIALEEHFALPALVKRLDPAVIQARGYPPPNAPAPPGLFEKMTDLGEGRLRAMDEGGISLQVLSLAGPSADLLPPTESPTWAQDANDQLAKAVAAHPDRYAGFAHLPLNNPEAAADELERCVKKLGFLGALISGTTDGLFLDDPRFEPVLARAEALDVPLYIHPGIPPTAVREAYYNSFPNGLSQVFATAGWGWHAETAVHIVRLVLAGTLDRHPRLKIIIGHMGEGLQAMLSRFDNVFGPGTKTLLKRSVSQTILDQVWVTTSGFFSLPPFLALLHSFGADRILFSVDYPFSANDRGTAFLNSLPVSPADREKIAWANAANLLKLKV